MRLDPGQYRVSPHVYDAGMKPAAIPFATQFDAELVRRYDIAGPRYTSYPTAPQFHAGFGETQFRERALASNASARDLSLYVHLPYCASPCFYCGCLRLITRDSRKLEVYLEYLQREIELVAPLFARDRRVVQLHLGGGTPNLLDTRQLETLLGALGRHFNLDMSAAREFGIEVDPRHADAESTHALVALGFNRISLGIQDFDVQVQRAINRVQSLEQTRAVIDAARGSGFRSVNVDLIYGLPKQTQSGFSATLDQVIALRPDRIAAYSYAHMPNLFKAQRHIDDADLPDSTTKLALLECTIDKLTRAGYRYIGMDHFALPTDDLAQAQDRGTLQRNFQGYSTHADCDLVGLGLSAIGKVGDSYSQNTKDLAAYYAALDMGRLPVVRGIVVSRDDAIRRDLISQLMCSGVVDIPAFERSHTLDFTSYFSDELERLLPLHRDDLVEIDASGLRVTARGRLLLRAIAMAFDAYLHQSPASPRHSRVI
jgi:oxygen-independent coproporphyrinogen-3 oxidase